jgi:dipeptidase E
MKLVLYSGGDNEENEGLDLELFKLIDGADPLFTFIPSSFEDADHYYEEFVHHYGDYGVRRFSKFYVDRPFDLSDAHKILESDLIYLSGGNTFYFLKHLKRSGMLKLLRDYTLQGGVLAGQSAGSIIMTPDISTASYPDFDMDENEVGIKNFKSMGLVEFQFFPHYLNTRRYIHELNLQSKRSNHPIFACPDGSGVIVEDQKTTFVGDAWGFLRGRKFKL